MLCYIKRVYFFKGKNIWFNRNSYLNIKHKSLIKLYFNYEKELMW